MVSLRTGLNWKGECSSQGSVRIWRHQLVLNMWFSGSKLILPEGYKWGCSEVTSVTYRMSPNLNLLSVTVILKIIFSVRDLPPVRSKDLFWFLEHKREFYGNFIYVCMYLHIYLFIYLSLFMAAPAAYGRPQAWFSSQKLLSSKSKIAINTLIFNQS